MRIAYILAVLIALVCTAPARADQTDPRLDDLFAQLADTGLPEAEARTLEREIWGIWRESGSATVDLLMSRTRQLGGPGGTPEQVATLFDSITRLAPDFAEGWNKRATAYYMNDEYQQALADIERTLRLEPRHFGALSGLGMIMVDYGDEVRALRAFRMALEINPHLPDIAEEVRRLQSAVEGQGI